MKTGWCLGPWPCAGRQRRRRGPRRARRRRRRRKRPRPQGDDLGSKLDRILEKLDSMERREEKEPEKEEKGAAKDDDMDRLKELLYRLAKEEAQTIPLDDAGCKKETGDTAANIIRKMRPAVAAIDNDAQRERVADALISCFSDADVMRGILSAAQDSAQKAADSAPVSFEKLCEVQKAAYDARNPHKQKEEK